MPQSAQIAITVAALLLLAVIGYFALVKPQKSKAASLTTEIAAQDNQITQARALLAKAKNAQKVRVADLFRLTKAMPDQADEAGIVLELTNVARQSGIDFESIAPQASTLLSGYQVIPVTVIFNGNFFQLNQGKLKFPQVQATLTVDAYIYGTGASVSAPPQTQTQTTTGSSGTATSATTTTTTPSATTTTSTTT